MVQIKFSVTFILLVVAGVVAPVIALPVPGNDGSVLFSFYMARTDD